MATDIQISVRSPVDAASLGVFRAAFGAMMIASVVRFWTKGWIAEFYVAPEMHFPYWGFDWLEPWPGIGMYLHFALLGLLALFIMVGFWSRAALALFFFAFTYVELLDRTTYLNHYYLISVLSLLLAFLPVDRAFSLSRALGWQAGPETVPRWSVYVVRLQVGLVYAFAGIAKLRSDWLLRGEPLHTWLAARGDVPIVGQYLADHNLALVASWSGAFFDLFIVLFLSWRRTRVFAYAAVVVFHLITGYLFNIGVFPIVMILSATIFFEPGWPRRFMRCSADRAETTPSSARPLGSALASLLVAHFVVQLAFPLRSALYPGNTMWTEEGYRFGWRVMLMEKTGEVDMRVVDNVDGRSWTVYPRDHLTPFQYRTMSTQPDMILTFAHHLADEWHAQGHEDVSVYADAWAALNGRSRQRLIDPEVDLAAESEGWGAKIWIMPLEQHDGVGAGPTAWRVEVQDGSGP